MDLVVSGTDDSLVEQLSFKLPSTASYANERRLVSAFPSGASQFSPDGVRVARFVITGENWLDPSTLRLAFKLKNLSATQTRQPRRCSWRVARGASSTRCACSWEAWRSSGSAGPTMAGSTSSSGTL